MLLPPRPPVPVPMPGLDWGQFSTVAVGYFITNVAAHRVSIHHAQTMLLSLRTLRERGLRFLAKNSWCLGMRGAGGVVVIKGGVFAM